MGRRLSPSNPAPGGLRKGRCRAASTGGARYYCTPAPSPRQACLRQTHPALPYWEVPWPSQASAGKPHSNRAQLHRIMSTTTTRDRAQNTTKPHLRHPAVTRRRRPFAAFSDLPQWFFVSCEFVLFCSFVCLFACLFVWLLTFCS